MSAAIEFHGLGLTPKGPTLTGRVEPGSTLCVVGPLLSGRSALLRCVAGLDRPHRGRVRLGGAAVFAGIEGFAGRATPQAICRRLAGRLSGAGPVAEALTVTRLWEHRQTPLGGLPDGARAACELLPLILKPGVVLVADCTFDRLDPWVRAGLHRILEERLRGGASLVVSTNDLSQAAKSDQLIVMRDSTPAFFGTPDSFLRSVGPTCLEVATENRPRVRGLVDSVAVEIEETPDGLILKVEDGQATAVKLLLEGYGDVKLVTVRRPDFAQALLERFHA